MERTAFLVSDGAHVPGLAAALPARDHHVVGAESEVRLWVAGSPVPLGEVTRLTEATDVRLESPGLTFRAARAAIEYQGRVVGVRPGS